MLPLVAAWALDRTFDYEVPDRLLGRVHPGVLVRCSLGSRRVRGIVVDVSLRIPPRDLIPLQGVVLDAPLSSPALTDVLEWTAARYVSTRAAAYKLVVPPRVRVPAAPRRARPRATATGSVTRMTGGADLLQAIAAGDAGTWALRVHPAQRLDALTDLVAAALRAERGAALVAVPEVGEEAGLLDDVTTRIAGVARIDSGVQPVSRSEGLLALARGGRVGIGGRGVVFAPAPGVRLIVVVDEHHPAFKEERAPRYEARAVALERARREGAVCVLLGSTPLLETAHDIRRKQIGLVEHDRDRERAERPVVEVVPAPEGHPLSPALLQRVRKEIGAGGRVGLVAHAAGFAPVLWCSSCRRSLRCPDCDSALAYDRGARRVRCPRCSYAAGAPEACPNCGGVEFRYLGAGTERIEEQLTRLFPGTRVARLDPDQPRPDVQGVQLYVTTWRGTKEAVRPEASFVAVLDADALIRRTDFRAAEAAHQALARMAEWAGPAARGGRLMLQTRDPAHHVLQAVTRGDYWFFADRELEIRRELGYPPFLDLVKLEAAGPRATEVLQQAAASARARGARVLGPVAVRQRGSAAQELLIKCEDAMTVGADLRDILAAAPAGARVRVDVDPR